MTTSATFAATEFVCTIREDGNGDFTSLQTWQDDIRCNLRDPGTLTAEWDNLTGALMARNTAVTWDGAAGSGTMVHMTTVAKSGKDAFLIRAASGTALAQGHVVTDGVNSFTVADGPDSVIAVARIEGTWNNPDGPLQILRDGWQSTRTNYIRIYTTGEARHQGKLSETAHRLRAETGYVIQHSEMWTVYDGLQLISDPATTNDTAVGMYVWRVREPAINVLKNSIITATHSITNLPPSENYYGIRAHDVDSDLQVVNCIVYLPVTPECEHIGVFASVGRARVYNTTVSGFSGTDGVGLRRLRTIYNSAVFDCTTHFGDTANTIISHTASGTGAGANAVHWTNGVTDWNNVFVDYADGDFRLNDYTGTGAIINKGMTDPIVRNAHRVRFNNGTLIAQGGVAIKSGFTGGTTAMTLSGTNTQMVSADAGVTPTTSSWTVDKAGGAVTLTTDLTLGDSTQDLLWERGVVDVGLNSLGIGRTLDIGTNYLTTLRWAYNNIDNGLISAADIVLDTPQNLVVTWAGAGSPKEGTFNVMSWTSATGPGTPDISVSGLPSGYRGLVLYDEGGKYIRLAVSQDISGEGEAFLVPNTLLVPNQLLVNEVSP